MVCSEPQRNETFFHGYKQQFFAQVRRPRTVGLTASVSALSFVDTISGGLETDACKLHYVCLESATESMDVIKS